MTIDLYFMEESAPARATYLAVKSLNLEVNIKNVDLHTGEQLTPEFQKMYPQHTIPVINDNGTIIWDSHAIDAYLVTKYAKDDSLYPKDPKVRAVVDQRQHFDTGVLFVRLKDICLPVVFHGVTRICEETKEKLFDAYGLLDKFLEGHNWVAGTPKPTIADLSCYATVSTLCQFFPVTAYPNVSAWLQRCKTLPGADVNEKGARTLGDFVKQNLEN